MKYAIPFVTHWVLCVVLIVAAPAAAHGQTGPFHIDHFKVHDVRDQTPLPNGDRPLVEVRGQFDRHFVSIQLRAITHFANPATKIVAGGETAVIQNPDAHLTWYRIDAPDVSHPPSVRVTNQFGESELTLGPPMYLVAPAAKDADEGSAVPKLSHFLAYPVLRGLEIGKEVTVKDQFGREDSLHVLTPTLFCVPVAKRYRGETFERIHGEEHLTVYEVAPRPRHAVDQFNRQGRELTFLPCRWLCVPSRKEIVELDHFKVYEVEEISIELGLELEGQFDERPQQTLLDALTHFANPVKKIVPGRPAREIENPDAHFTWYRIAGRQGPFPPDVTVTNQFGTQYLALGPARFLLVPAEKREPGSRFPETLDHYKAYEVRSGLPPRVSPISLRDQFGIEEDVAVLSPRFFAVPVSKTLRSGESFPVRDMRTHFTIYDVAPRPHQVKDQFATRTLDFVPCEMLCVPSLKRVTPTSGPHFLLYDVQPLVLDPAPEIRLEDQFLQGRFLVREFVYFANPVSKNREEIPDVTAHFKVYQLEGIDPVLQPVLVNLKDQFGSQSFRITEPVLLLSPSGKGDMPRPEGLDHYLAYQIEGGRSPAASVSLRDQFLSEDNVSVKRPLFFCVPVEKHHEDIVLRQNPDLYFTLYELPSIPKSEFRNAEDQFGTLDAITAQTRFLAVPPMEVVFLE